jgi:hypothetical protein
MFIYRGTPRDRTSAAIGWCDVRKMVADGLEADSVYVYLPTPREAKKLYKFFCHQVYNYADFVASLLGLALGIQCKKVYLIAAMRYFNFPNTPFVNTFYIGKTFCHMQEIKQEVYTHFLKEGSIWQTLKHTIKQDNPKSILELYIHKDLLLEMCVDLSIKYTGFTPHGKTIFTLKEWYGLNNKAEEKQASPQFLQSLSLPVYNVYSPYYSIPLHYYIPEPEYAYSYY